MERLIVTKIYTSNDTACRIKRSGVSRNNPMKLPNGIWSQSDRLICEFVAFRYIYMMFYHWISNPRFNGDSYIYPEAKTLHTCMLQNGFIVLTVVWSFMSWWTFNTRLHSHFSIYISINIPESPAYDVFVV